MIKRFCDVCGKELKVDDVPEPQLELGVVLVKLTYTVRGMPGDLHVSCLRDVVAKGRQP